MAEGRAFVYPQAIAFGARPLDVPGRGSVLCASAFFAFRLSDGERVRPADWYEAVSTHGGEGAIPDSMAPLPGAELLVLGALPPIDGTEREAFLSCGTISKHFTLYRDPDAPQAPALAGPAVATWHAEDNPGGRGGPDDDRSPLIVDRQDAKRPLWLGPTPFDHPVRLRRIGVPDESSGAGWPAQADATVFHDAHDAFWGKALYPGEPLRSEGILSTQCIDRLPPYRISITSGRDDARWIQESARVHCVTLIPGAGLAAMTWRAVIDLGDDVLGESVIALVAALEDAQTAPKDEWHWAGIAVERWEDPARALDDRPLLPAALAAAVTLPFAPPPEGDPIDARLDAAKEWMQRETGAPEENPFADTAPKEAGLADKMLEAASSDEEPPDANAIGDMAVAALAGAKRKHEAAGFPEPDPDKARTPVPRGPKLETEIADRLREPYQTRHEIEMAHRINAGAAQPTDGRDVLSKLADVRIRSPNPPLLWPAMLQEDAVEFGNEISQRLRQADPERHIDISGAVVEGEASFVGRRFNGLLAEETAWQGSEFTDCEFVDASFAGARFESCAFRDCMFERVNLSRATLEGDTFTRCTFRDSQWMEPVWMNGKFHDCTFERVSLIEAAMRDLEFARGEWREMQWTDGLLVGLALRGTNMREVTFSSIHAPYSRFEQLSMFKVWALSRGFPGSVFERVEGTTCGFLAECHFDECRFVGSRFVETGFSGAVFASARMEDGCRFDVCDFSGAVFTGTELARTRFLRCSMATSVWQGANAAEAWFFGSALRGVDFADTELARAVFADADIEGTKFDPDRTIGADFRGTTRAIA